MSLLAISEILALFFNILTADRMYSPWNSENLQQSIQMQFSKEQKILVQNFVYFLNLYQVLNIWKKNHPNSLRITENPDCERFVR